MTNAPRKKRPWFQLHLSTCVVLMFVAGFILMKNISVEGGGMTGISMAGTISWYRTYYIGWPGPFLALKRDCGYTRLEDLDDKFSSRWETQEEPLPSEEPTPSKENPDPPTASMLLGLSVAKAGDTISLHALTLLINATIWLGALSMIALACEWFIRRRERARAGSVPGPDTARAE